MRILRQEQITLPPLNHLFCYIFINLQVFKAYDDNHPYELKGSNSVVGFWALIQPDVLNALPFTEVPEALFLYD